MIREWLPIPQKTYQITKMLKTLEKVLDIYFPGLVAFIDCTEQQIQSRPIDKERRKIFYSLGKKKRHTVKNQFMVNNHRGYILDKIGHKKGRRGMTMIYTRITILIT